MKKRLSITISPWYAQPTRQSTLWLTTQPRPGWTPAHRGSYVLCYPNWYRLKKEGMLQRVGLTAIPKEEKVGAMVARWYEDLEALIGGPLDEQTHAFRVQLPYTLFSTTRLLVTHHPDYFFHPEQHVLVGPFLYRTDARGRLQMLGECSSHTIVTVEDFERRVQQLAGISPVVILPVRSPRTKAHRALGNVSSRPGSEQMTTMLKAEAV